MTQAEIQAGNKLIHEFMGFVYRAGCSEIRSGWWTIRENEHFFHGDGALPYNVSWGWLMPVVEKIESIETEKDGRFIVKIYWGQCHIQGHKGVLNTRHSIYDSHTLSMAGKLEATWLQVVKFIKFYNELTRTSV